MERREARQDLTEMWGETPEGRLNDEVNSWKNTIFYLRQLFGEEPYKIFEEEEEWWDLCIIFILIKIY